MPEGERLGYFSGTGAHSLFIETRCVRATRVSGSAASLFDKLFLEERKKSMDENLIGVREASRILGITIPAVHYHILQGRISVIGKFGNSFILDRNAIEVFRAKREARR